MTHASQYLAETATIARAIYSDDVESLAIDLSALRERGGRLFLVGLGGSAANTAHAANDLRKLCAIDAIALAEHASEFSAWANDDGLENAYALMLDARCAVARDALMVFSVGGGTQTVSLAITNAVIRAKEIGMSVWSILGRAGEAARLGDRVLMVPEINPRHVTPHAESFQMVLIHCLASHPLLQRRPTKW